MSTPALVLVPLALAAVFLVSGIAKLGRGRLLLDSMRELGLPRVIRRRWIAELFPVGEIVLAFALLASGGVAYRVVAALFVAVTSTLTVIIAIPVIRRDRVACACFGALDGAPVTGWTVARNVALVALSTSALFGAGSGPVMAVARFALRDMVWLGLVALLIAAALLLFPRGTGGVDQIAATADGIMGGHVVGSGVEVVDERGNPVPIADLARNGPAVLIFVRAECAACAEIARRMPAWRAQLGDSASLRTLTSATPERLRADYPELADDVYFGYRSAVRELRVVGVPAVVVLGPGGVIERGPAVGVDAIGRLMAGLVLK